MYVEGLLMKKFVKIMAVIAAMGVMMSFAGCASTPTTSKIKEKGVITMATNAAFPPFEYVKDNKVSGVDVDVANEIAKDLGVKLEIKDMNFDSVIPSVKAGKFDFGAAGITIREDRLKEVDFSVEYVKSSQYMVVQKGKTFTKDDLANMVVGVQAATTGDLYASGEFDEDVKAKEVKQYNTAVEAATDLKLGRIDAVIVDELPAKTIVESAADELEMIDEKLTEESYALCVKKGNKTLLESINKTLERLMNEGKIDEYVINHMGK